MDIFELNGGITLALISRQQFISMSVFYSTIYINIQDVVTLLYKYRISGILKFNFFVTNRAPSMPLHSLHACRKSLPDGRRRAVDQRYIIKNTGDATKGRLAEL